MTLLFYTHTKVYATRGGTERTTVSVATALTRHYGCRCYSLYEQPDSHPREDCFEDEWQWQAGYDRAADVSFWRRLIEERHIDFIIDQGIFMYVPLLKEAAEGTGCKVVLAHHYEPGAEVKLYYTLRHHWQERHMHMPLRQRCRWLADLALFPLARRRNTALLRRSYREAYTQADCVVLLSESFINLYQSFAQLKEGAKFAVIPNGLSFTTFLPEDRLAAKQKEALIVARMDEGAKRISLALKIWQQAQRRPEAQGWTLRIVGEGPDLPAYRRMAARQGIAHVSFEGRQVPQPYYERASIFLMTSATESWGLTLTEAQQMGGIPIVLDTYASLREIVSDGENGYIVPEGRTDLYVSRLVSLMADPALRARMGAEAIRSAHRFSQESIARQWHSLLERLGR